MRLQTVPETFEFPVSDSQAYKMLGNGWTVDVIAHIMRHFDGITTEPLDVLSMYDGMACGHIALDNLGANIRNYYATEIDKYAIATATHNFPDIVELGDAFKIRWDMEGPSARTNARTLSSASMTSSAQRRTEASHRTGQEQQAARRRQRQRPRQ